MTSISFEQTIVIPRSLDFVYGYLSDFTNTAAWDPSVIQAQKTTPGPIKLGTHFDIKLRFAWTETSLNYHITQVEPNRYLELKGVAESYSVVDRLRFEGDANSCSLHYQIEVYYQAPMSRFVRVFAPLVKAKARHAMAALERTLKGTPSDWQPRVLGNIADRLLLPGLYNFTRRGYIASKSRWTGITRDMSRQTVLITGASSGIGAAAARSLGKLGANLVIVARNEKKAAQFGDLCVAEGMARPRVEIADLSLIADVEALAQRMLKRGEPIHVLINNAGALFNQRVVTSEGIEQSFATLLLSPYTLTEALYPLLKQGRPSRVINVASGGMYTQAIQLDDLEYEHKDYNGSKAYARAKRGLVDMTELWAERWQSDGIIVHAMHPGWANTPAVANSLPEFYERSKNWLRTPDQGADTVVWLAAAPEAADSTGLFWLDRSPHSTAILPHTRSSRATQEALEQKLKAFRLAAVASNPL